ncbi:phytoene/squalene synthase family protein [Pontiella desulfatans]|nr:phytoene/squalene synthase family protein [Pontiella desulfatans]
MRHYTTGFFIVSRFLPKVKRDDVELIYAAVRYPDEVVDTFKISDDHKKKLLAEWRNGYRAALKPGGILPALGGDVPPFVAAFSDLVQRHEIPVEYYESFLDAMEFDIAPRPFDSLEDLIGGYIYGSAIVVGYFLTHVYGACAPDAFDDAMQSARDLGIGLQLTNFLRDIQDDARRGRVYLPTDILEAHGISAFNPSDEQQQEQLRPVVKEMTQLADGYYEKSFQTLNAFHPDSRIAIKACIDVYRMLNTRIADSGLGIHHRESVPLVEKLKPLPTSKFWRIPLAYLLP